MSKPTDKMTLITASKSYFDLLFDFIDNLQEKDQEKTFPIGTMNRNIRDVLAHLYQWQLMLMAWYQTGLENKKPDIPAKGYTWKTVPELNKKIWADSQNISLKEMKICLHQSHDDIMKIIEKHTNEDLFEKKKYSWTGSTSLGAYFISATSSHYNWALKLIKKAYKHMPD